jgi:hypothetical protein
MVEMQKALNAFVDSIDTTALGKALERQIGEQGIRCYKCGQISKNLRGNSAHLRKHR